MLSRRENVKKIVPQNMLTDWAKQDNFWAHWRGYSYKSIHCSVKKGGRSENIIGVPQRMLTESHFLAHWRGHSYKPIHYSVKKGSRSENIKRVPQRMLRLSHFWATEGNTHTNLSIDHRRKETGWRSLAGEKTQSCPSKCLQTQPKGAIFKLVKWGWESCKSSHWSVKKLSRREN